MDHHMPRIVPIKPKDMDAAQRRLYDNIISGPRGGMGGPFRAWMHSPIFGDRAQAVGEYCRCNSVLAPRLSELAILITARQWSAQFEWYAHAPMAIKSGLSPKIIAAIQCREVPQFSKPTSLQFIISVPNFTLRALSPTPLMNRQNNTSANKASWIWLAYWDITRWFR